METLKKEGKILNWGIGPGQEEAVCDVINSTTPPDAIQCGVNILNSLGAIGYASIKPNPKLESSLYSLASLSKPAARPIGFGKRMPNTWRSSLG